MLDPVEQIREWAATERERFDGPADLYGKGRRGSAGDLLDLIDSLPSADAGYVIVKVPVLPYPGASPQSLFYKTAARNVREGFPVGGSNVTAAVAELLASVGAALAAREETQ
jgi:hypothetical protein